MNRSNIVARVTDNFNNRLSRLITGLDLEYYPIIDEVFNMKSQDCFSVFSVGNETLDNLETLYSMLINGLYDDSYLGIVKDTNGFYTISQVSDDFDRILDAEEVRDIVRKKPEQSTYYAENKDFIEGHYAYNAEGVRYTSREYLIKYMSIGREFDTFMRTFMVESDRKELERIDKKNNESIRTLAESYKTK